MGYWHDPDNSVFHPVHEPADDIDYLMLHQDCEGILPLFAVRRVRDRLLDIVPRITQTSLWPSFDSRLQAEQLLNFFEYASEEGHMVVFSG
jgi:hypothetical protein